MKPQTTIRRALDDRNLLGSVLSGDSWAAWRVLLIASMGEELTGDERELFKQLTGREREPGQRIFELAVVAGRRGGKSRAISVLAAYIAGLTRHPSLVPGERGVLLIIAPDQKQADIVLNYTTANFESSPILRQLIEARTARELRLTNGIDIEVRASDFRRLRGPSYVAVISDECAFYMAENSSNPDSEILNAVRPGLATTGGPLFLISSPYARRGELWRLFSKHFGPLGDPAILVARGSSRTFNSTLPQSVVDRAIERDPASASAEFLAQFRSDIEGFVSLEAVRACVSSHVYERAPVSGIHFSAFIDAAGGGGGGDSFTLAIGHTDRDRSMIVIDCLRETKPPFSPETVIREYAAVLKTYRVDRITADKWAGGFPVEAFDKFNIRCEQSAKPKSDLYVDLLPLINSARIELLDNQRLIAQLCSLERRTGRSGRDSIDHAPGGHDDIANAVAGVCAALVASSHNYDTTLDWVMGDVKDIDQLIKTDNPPLNDYLSAYFFHQQGGWSGRGRSSSWRG